MYTRKRIEVTEATKSTLTALVFIASALMPLQSPSNDAVFQYSFFDRLGHEIDITLDGQTGKVKDISGDIQ